MVKHSRRYLVSLAVAGLAAGALAACGDSDTVAGAPGEAEQGSPTEIRLPAPTTGDAGERFRSEYGPDAVPPAADATLVAPLVDGDGRTATTACELEDPLVGDVLRGRTWTEVDELAAAAGYVVVAQAAGAASTESPARLGGAPNAGASLMPDGSIALSMDERNDRIFVCLDDTDRIVGSWVI